MLTWQNRIMRSQERRTDLDPGCVSWRWRVIRTSNASVFRDLLHGSDSVLSCKAENRSGTRNQEILEPILAPAPLETARSTCLSPIGAAFSSTPDRPRTGAPDAPACSAALVTLRLTDPPPWQIGSIRGRREPARQQRQQAWRQQ